MRFEARKGLDAVAATTHFRLYESVAIGSVAWERQTRDVCSHPKPSCCRSSVERGPPLPVAQGMEAREMRCDRGQMSSVQRSRHVARPPHTAGRRIARSRSQCVLGPSTVTSHGMRKHLSSFSFPGTGISRFAVGSHHLR